MNRRHFLSSLLTAVAGLTLLKPQLPEPESTSGDLLIPTNSQWNGKIDGYFLDNPNEAQIPDGGYLVSPGFYDDLQKKGLLGSLSHPVDWGVVGIISFE